MAGKNDSERMADFSFLFNCMLLVQARWRANSKSYSPASKSGGTSPPLKQVLSFLNNHTVENKRQPLLPAGFWVRRDGLCGRGLINNEEAPQRLRGQKIAAIHELQTIKSVPHASNPSRRGKRTEFYGFRYTAQCGRGPINQDKVSFCAN